MSRGGCQARMGVVVVPCAAAGTRTFALDSRASVPTWTTVARAIKLASIPGEEGSSPGPPPLPSRIERHSGCGWATGIGILMCVETFDSSPVDLLPQQREARLNAVLADVRAGHSTAEGVLIVGGREAQLLWYATVDAYIAGIWVATILCGQATCERVLAGLVSFKEVRSFG